MKIIIGIDPGINGGIAVIRSDGRVLRAAKMPATPQDIFSLLSLICKEPCQKVAYMEKVGTGMPGQSSKATATFARHCGQLDMALLALEVPVNTVTPNKWEKFYQLGSSSGISKTEWKNRLKAKAQQLFPYLGKLITLATCDALLIAEYGRKMEGCV